MRATTTDRRGFLKLLALVPLLPIAARLPALEAKPATLADILADVPPVDQATFEATRALISGKVDHFTGFTFVKTQLNSQRAGMTYPRWESQPPIFYREGDKVFHDGSTWVAVGPRKKNLVKALTRPRVRPQFSSL